MFLPNKNYVRKHSSKSKSSTILTLNSSCRTLGIKVYSEQIPHGEDDLIKRIHSIPKNEYQILMIRHDRDTKVDSFGNPVIVKPHYHIMIRKMDGDKTAKNPFKVRSYLNLLGIKFRKGVDDNLIKHHGIERLGDFSYYANYITHDTYDAQIKGKEIYKVSEIISNLTEDEIIKVREECLAPSPQNKADLYLELLEKEARKLGYQLGDFECWYHDDLAFTDRKLNKKPFLKDAYERGVAMRIQEDNYITRSCIYIQGPPDIGKSYGSIETLKDMGLKNIKDISNQGSGKYDDITLATEAIIISDDTTIDNMEDLMDNKITQLKRRNRNNPYFKGQYVIVTANVPFDDWLKKSGIAKEQWDAVRSRMFIFNVEIVDNEVKTTCLSGSVRGTSEIVFERAKLTRVFIQGLQKKMTSYYLTKKSIHGINFTDYFSNL